VSSGAGGHARWAAGAPSLPGLAPRRGRASVAAAAADAMTVWPHHGRHNDGGGGKGVNRSSILVARPGGNEAGVSLGEGGVCVVGAWRDGTAGAGTAAQPLVCRRGRGLRHHVAAAPIRPR